RNVLPARSWAKNIATKTVWVLSAPPWLVTAMARGAVPNGLRSTVAVTAFVAVLITDRLLDAELATYSVLPAGDRAKAAGSTPTAIVLVTASVCRFTTDTVPPAALAT